MCRTVSQSFTAQYPDQCADCDEEISPGQSVHYDADHDLVHDACPDVPDDDAPRRNERRCGDCFTTHAGDCL